MNDAEGWVSDERQIFYAPQTHTVINYDLFTIYIYILIGWILRVDTSHNHN